MNTTHTPAPWHCRPVPDDSRDNNRTYWIDREDGAPIADIFNLGEKVALANAQLIASAPELLEALEKLFENCAMIHNQWGDGDNSKSADNAIAAARRAIAKAKGEN